MTAVLVLKRVNLSEQLLMLCGSLKNYTKTLIDETVLKGLMTNKTKLLYLLFILFSLNFQEEKSKSSETQDLIRLDSTPSDESEECQRENGETGIHSLTNPLYPYFSSSSPGLAGSQSAGDMDLLREYGLDFNSFTLQPTTPASSKREWTKFE